LFTGDAVLGRGTSVIDPPEGDLMRYMRSLKRMQDLSPRTIYPGHGPVVLRAAGKLAEYVAHRAMREQQVLSALREGVSTPEEMAPTIYAGYPPEVHELAVRSLLAHLLKLEAEGRAEKRVKGGVTRWSVAEPRSCARCGRPVKGRALLCGPCSLAVLQESG
jgi:glyoxylase-like metal-dependent hydrolase (beta-lactamase superfamily II)